VRTPPGDRPTARPERAGVIVSVTVALLIVACSADGGERGAIPTTSLMLERGPTAQGAPADDPTDGSDPGSSATGNLDGPPAPDGTLSPPEGFRRPWSGTVQGILTFRGNPTRSWYGTGPMPADPAIRWRYPGSGGMCAQSTVGSETKEWCGTGWTGQPAVFERDGRTWVVFGAYDRRVHFLDAEDGTAIIPPFATGDLVKGSVTVDPDGYPLVYIGSRDNYFRVISFDGPEPVELWSLAADAVSPTLWNNDWDGAALVLDDLLVVGGENSQFHVVRLHRGHGPDGMVTVDPQLVFNTPGWDDQLLSDLAGNRARDVSIEGSVTAWRDTVYFANGGGLVQGWDLAPLREGGTPQRTFRFWTGDDTDASIVADTDGHLYVAVEFERDNQRGREVGQLIKLDPSSPDDPLVWSHADRDTVPAGFWATPAVLDDVVINAANSGEVLALDRGSGELLWSFELAGPTWQSPVVVDDVLVQGDCSGTLHGFDLSDPRRLPAPLWSVELGGCIESTPAVWRGRMFVGTRGGSFFSVGD